MKRFSPFFLLTGWLALGLGLRANAQAGPPAVGSLPALVATRALHSSQLPTEAGMATAVAESGRYANKQPVSWQEAATPTPAPVAGPSVSPQAASQAQLLLLLGTIEAQQARLDALQAETEAALRRANRAEAATVAFEQRLRQLEAVGSRPSFWR